MFARRGQNLHYPPISQSITVLLYQTKEKSTKHQFDGKLFIGITVDKHLTRY